MCHVTIQKAYHNTDKLDPKSTQYPSVNYGRLAYHFIEIHLIKKHLGEITLSKIVWLKIRCICLNSEFKLYLNF